MRTNTITKVFGVILTVIILNNTAFAQKEGTLPPVTVTGTKISEKVWASFRSSFKEAVDPRWYRIDQDFLVKFLMNEQDQSALFSKRGNLIYNISYGTEKHLPADIRRQIKSIYLDHKIVQTFSIREAGRLIWVVNLEDDKNMLVVRVEDGEIEEAKNYKKST